MGYLRGFGVMDDTRQDYSNQFGFGFLQNDVQNFHNEYGLGQDDGTGAGDGSDDEVDVEDPVTTPFVPYGPSVPSGLMNTTPTPVSATTPVSSGSSSSGSSLSSAQLDAALTQLLQGGTKIAQIATGTTGSLQVTSNELLIGAAILAAIFIVPAVLSKK
jgi:hypothetical protein